MSLGQNLLLAAACVVAGVINAMAGGGSLITVPLLSVFADLGGLVANGTNRVGVLTQNLSSTFSYRRAGVSGIRKAVALLVPVFAGSLVGAFVVSRISETAYEIAFGSLMVPLLVFSFWRPKRAAPAGPAATDTSADGADGPAAADTGADGAANPAATNSATASPAAGRIIAWPRYVTIPIFVAIGMYGGAFQAGVGLIIVLALSRAGLDLVNANAVKVVLIAMLTVAAVPVFIFSDQVHWGFAAIVSVGFAVGGWIGARFAVSGGERLIRPVMLVAVVALAGRMVGLY